MQDSNARIEPGLGFFPIHFFLLFPIRPYRLFTFHPMASFSCEILTHVLCLVRVENDFVTEPTNSKKQIRPEKNYMGI